MLEQAELKIDIEKFNENSLTTSSGHEVDYHVKLNQHAIEMRMFILNQV